MIGASAPEPGAPMCARRAGPPPIARWPGTWS